MLRVLLFAAALAAPPDHPSPSHPQEEAVPDYPVSDFNAGADPLRDPPLWAAFHGAPGVQRIVNDLVDRSVADPRIADIFKGHDLVRLRRTLNEQFCYLLGGGCAYTGRDMAAAHKDLGLQAADFNALVEDLQAAMDHEGVAFRAQNRLLARLAPMARVTIER